MATDRHHRTMKKVTDAQILALRAKEDPAEKRRKCTFETAAQLRAAKTAKEESDVMLGTFLNLFTYPISPNQDAELPKCVVDSDVLKYVVQVILSPRKGPSVRSN